MSGFIIKVYMKEVNPKTFAYLHNILSGSANDAENLLVHLEDLNWAISELADNDEIKEFIKNILEAIGDKEVKYVWFYL